MSEISTSEAPDGGFIITGKFHRTQRGHGKELIEGSPHTPPHEPVRRPARLAIMLALAHKIQWAIDRGALPNRAEAARRLGITRARVTQLLDLTLIAPDIQEQVLALESIDGIEPMNGRMVRAVARVGTWSDQRHALVASDVNAFVLA